MKKKKLLQKLSDYFDMGKRKQCEQKSCLKKIIRELREKEHKLSTKLQNEESEIKRKRLKKESQIIHAQRLKGLKRLKALRCDE
ncbi:hypothetical protein [Solemya velesiana gill symbiont]|uniref:Uncharacterized protein n=1 Tax=Solemya velesiana gill symbiont TaxID=1918948 RepID=A0A1T2KSZ2_9GAMM|nr:hypothetical protein [Solemya velesiana gill symbiont]OOZ35911.1 hypothetical protein BOW51_09755 [Solemya velesiana gill symbiont]